MKQFLRCGFGRTIILYLILEENSICQNSAATAHTYLYECVPTTNLTNRKNNITGKRVNFIKVRIFTPRHKRLGIPKGFVTISKLVLRLILMSWSIDSSDYSCRSKSIILVYNVVRFITENRFIAP